MGSLTWLFDCLCESDVLPAEKMVDVFRDAGKLMIVRMDAVLQNIRERFERGFRAEAAYVCGNSVIVEETWNE